MDIISISVVIKLFITVSKLKRPEWRITLLYSFQLTSYASWIPAPTVHSSKKCRNSIGNIENTISLHIYVRFRYNNPKHRYNCPSPIIEKREMFNCCNASLSQQTDPHYSKYPHELSSKRTPYKNEALSRFSTDIMHDIQSITE